MNQQKGFTLVEVVVSVVLVGIALLPLYNLFELTLLTAKQTETQLQATQTAQQIVERVKGTEYGLLSGLNETNERAISFTLGNGENKGFMELPENLTAEIILTPNVGEYIYQVASQMIEIEPFSEGSKQGVMINGYRYLVDSGLGSCSIPLLLELAIEEGENHEKHMQASVKILPSLGESEERTLYTQTTVDYPSLFKIYLASPEQKIELRLKGGDGHEQIPVHIIKQGNIGGEVVFVNPQLGEVTYYDIFRECIDTSQKLVLSYEDGEPQKLTLQGGDVNIVKELPKNHKPLVQLEATTHATDVNVHIENHTQDILEIDIGDSDILYEVEKGLISKTFHRLRPKNGEYMIYNLYVKVSDSEGAVLAEIHTTKME